MLRCLTLSLLLALTSCANTPEVEIRYIETPVEKEYIHPEMPAQIELNRANWFIIELEDGLYAAVPSAQFDGIVSNNITIGDYINELKAIIVYYRDVTGYSEDTSNEN